MRWSWVNFQCRGVLLVLIKVGQGPTALAVGAGGGCLDIFTLIYSFSPLSPSLWEAARYRLKYCLKGPLKPNQPTNQPIHRNIEDCNSIERLSSFYAYIRSFSLSRSLSRARAHAHARRKIQGTTGEYDELLTLSRKGN